jgi:hypothetical protein
MEANLKKSILTIGKLLEKYNIKYMIVGGAAVALNGYYRHSLGITGEITEKPDIDIWYNPTYENYFNILKFMHELGLDVTEFKEEQSPNPRKSFFKLDFPDFTLDILPEIKSTTKFIEANERKEVILIEDALIYYICLDDLIDDKKATARKKDIEDIEQLKKITNME